MQKKILIVDDDEQILELLKEVLSAQEYEILTTQSSNEALILAKNETVSVIFIDLHMPEMSGIDLCRKIREFNKLAYIAAITGNIRLFEISECREAGFDDYFNKPLDMKLIINNTECAFKRLQRWIPSLKF